MHLTLTPQMGLPGQPEMTIHVAGDTITLDGVAYDLSTIPEGGAGHFEHDTPFLGQIRRVNGMLQATLIARLGSDFPTATPEAWVIEDASGTVSVLEIAQGITA